MAIFRVKASRLNTGKKHQTGATLVEFMMAATLSLIALAAVGSVFISGQKLATERGKQLLLTQNLSDALKYIKEDVRRAGYSRNAGHSLILSGASSVISTSSTNDSLQYVYKNKDDQYEGIQLKKAGEKLFLCLKTEDLPLSESDLCTKPLSLMDDRLVKLTDFNVSKTPLGGSVSSALVTISISAKLGNTTSSQTMSGTIKQRNWQ